VSFVLWRPRVPRVIREARESADVVAVIDPDAPVVYVGLVTRVIAFAVDAAIIDLVALSTAAVTALAMAMFNLPEDLEKAALAVGAVLFVLWSIGYFVFFWSTTGQTPGARIMRFRVLPASGHDPLLPRRALVRFFGLILAALPLFAGYLLILVDNRRRGLQDYLARTVVVEHHDDASLRWRDRARYPASARQVPREIGVFDNRVEHGLAADPLDRVREDLGPAVLDEDGRE
jgi:uncharacterized RDD family membrane protein YckC